MKIARDARALESLIGAAIADELEERFDNLRRGESTMTSSKVIKEDR